MVSGWYVKRYWEYGDTEVSTVIDVCSTKEAAEAKVRELRERYQSTQYVVEPYDAELAKLWPIR